MSYINVEWVGEIDNPTDDVRLERLLSTFNKMEKDKLEWFTNYIQHSNLFVIGDPVYIFKERVKQAIFEEAILSRKYYFTRNSLEELTRNIRKVLKEKFNCVIDIWLPLLDSDDSEAWDKARRTRDLGQLIVTAEKEFEGMGKVKVVIGEIE